MRQDHIVWTGEGYEPLSRFRVASASWLDDALAVMRTRNPEVFSISSAVGIGTCEFVVNDGRFAQIGVTFLSYRRQVLVQAHEPTALNIIWTTTGKGLLKSGSIRFQFQQVTQPSRLPISSMRSTTQRTRAELRS
jgi:hypothetical protein